MALQRTASSKSDNGMVSVMGALLMGAAFLGCGAPATTSGSSSATPAPVAAKPQSSKQTEDTVESFVSKAIASLDKQVDLFCACNDLVCANLVEKTFTVDAEVSIENPSPELLALLEEIEKGSFGLVSHLREHRSAWFEQMDSRTQICVRRLVANAQENGTLPRE
jgi:hypothetical protein